MTTDVGAADCYVALNGTLVYLSGGLAATAPTLVWLDRQGREESIKTPPRAYAYPRIAPDGKRIIALMPVETTEAQEQEAQNQVIFLINFSDEVRRKVRVGK